MSSHQTSTLVITDPRPVPRDGRCPTCGAPESARQPVTAFGRRPWQACSACGHEFAEDETHE